MRVAAFLFLGMTWIAGAGCASSDPLVAWQDRLEEYVDKEGNGDLNALRDTVDLRSRRGLRPARITFGRLNIPTGGPWPLTSWRDVQGVLIGLQETEGRLWYLFLVGVMRTNGDRTSGITDMRLVGLADDGQQHVWRVSAADHVALARYKAGPQHETPDRTDVTFPEVFPSVSDVYRLTQEGSTAWVTEERSGAQWRLALVSDGPH